MATEIDKRVVEMQFDNKDFEKNCQASLTTLEKLKMALNFDGAKGLESMSKAASKVDLSNISKGADEVSLKFSAMQIAGMTAIQEITRGLMNFGRNVWANTFGQIKTGGMSRTLKIEQAIFQMNALAKNIKGVGEEQEKVNALIAKMKDAIDKSVTGTAYGYDAAAAVASQLMASGLTNADTMYNHLRAIAGAAAMTGRSFEDIGNIFTTVASNGRLMTMQLRQFSASGLNLSATLAQSLGKTEDQINDMVTKGKISFETFSKALYDAFGDAAGKADDTFQGVTSNIKAQLSRIGQLFTDPFVENVIPFFKEVKARIKDVNTVLKPVAKTWTEFFKYVSGLGTVMMKNLNVSKFRYFVNGVENILVALIEIIWTVGRAFREVFGQQFRDELHQGVVGFDRFTRQLIPSTKALEEFKTIVKAVLIPFKALWTIGVAVVKNAIYPLLTVFVRFVRAIVTLADALRPVINELLIFVSNGEFLSNVLMIITDVLVNLAEVLVTIIECVAELISQITKSGTFRMLVDILKEVAILLADAITYSLLFINDILNKILSLINSETIHAFFDFVIGAFAYLLLTIMSIAEWIGNVIDRASQSDNLLGNILKMFREIWQIVKNLFSGNDISQNLSNLGLIMVALGQNLKDLWDKFVKFLHDMDAGRVIVYAFSISLILLILSVRNVLNAIAGIGETVKTGIQSIVDTLGDIRKVLAGMIKASPALQVLLGISVAIATLALSLYLLAKVPFEKLAPAAIILGVFAGGIVAFTMALSKLNLLTAGEGTLVIVPFLLSIGAAILMLSLALTILAKANLTLRQLIAPLVAVSVVLVLLTGAIIAINKTMQLMFPEEKKLALSAGAILAFAVSIAILTKCVLALVDVPLAQAATGLLVVAGLMVSLAGAMALVGAIGFSFAGGMGALAFVVSFILLMNAIKKISQFPFEQMIIGLKNAGVVVAALAALYLAMVGISLLAGGNVFMQNIAHLLFGFTALVAVCSASVFLLGSMDQSIIARGTAVVSYLAIIFAGVTKFLAGSFSQFSKEMKTYKDLNILKSFSSFLIAFSACIVLLVLACQVAQGVTLTGWLTVAGVMVILAGCAYAIMMASAHTKRAKVSIVIAFIAGIISILAMMAILSYVDTEHLAFAIAAVDSVMLGLWLLADKFSKLGSKAKEAEKEEGKAGNTAAIMAVFILGIIGIIASLSYLARSSENLNTDTLSAITVALAIVFAGLVVLVGAITYFSSKVKDTNKLLAVAGSLAITLAAIGIIGAVMAGMTFAINDWENVLFSVISLLEVLSIFAVVMISFDWFIEQYKKHDVESEDVKNVAKAIIAMSTALAIIAGSITGMSVIINLNPDRIGGSLIAFVEILVMFGVIIISLHWIMTEYKKAGIESDDLKTVANSIFVVSSSLIMIAAAITGMSLVLATGNGLTLVASIFAWIEIMSTFAIVMQYFSKLIEKTKDLEPGDILTLAKVVGVLGAVLAVIGGVIITMSLILGNDLNSLFASLASFGELVLAFVVIIKVFQEFLQKVGGMDPKVILKVASSIVIVSSTLAIIAGSIGILTAIIGSDPNRMASALASFIFLIVTFAGVVGALYLLQKNTTSSTKLLAVAGSIALASSALLIIAGAILMLKDVQVDETFAQKMAALIVPFGILVALFAIVAAVGNDLQPLSVLAMSGSILLGAMALLIMANAVRDLVNATKDVNPSNLDNVKKIFDKFVIILVVLTAIGGILGGLNILGAGVIAGIFVIIGAFTLFAIGVDVLASAVDKFVDAAIKMNSVTIEGEKLKQNFINAVSGIAEGIRAAIPEILEATLYLIGLVLAVVLLLKNKAVLIGISYVLAFLAGIEAALPAILSMVSMIMKEVVDWLEADENMGLIERFFEDVGSMLVHIIGGALKGLLGEMGKLFDEFLEEHNLDAPGFGTANAALKKGSEMALEKREKDAQMQRVDNILSYYNLYENAANTTADTWDKIVDDFNRIAEAARESGEELNEKTRETALSYLSLAPEESLNRLDSAYYGVSQTVDEFTDKVEVSNETLNSGAQTASNGVQHLSQNVAEAGDSITGVGDKAQEAADKTTDAIDSATERAEKFSIDWDAIKEKVSSYGDGFVKGLENMDIKSVSKKLGVEHSALGSVLGKITGTSFGEDYEYTLEHYMNDAMTKIYDHNGQWQYKWKTFKDEEGKQIYSSAEQYANAMMDKQTNNTSFALTKLAEFLGINLDVNDALGDGTDLLGDFGESMESVGDSADKAKSKLEEFRDGVRDSIAQAMHGIFDEVSEQEYIDPDEMLYRMEENTRRVGEWARNIATLAARGMSEGLLNELKDMGPAGAAKVQAFVDMTDDQLKMANRRWNAANFLPDYGTKEIEQAYRDAGFNASLGFTEGIDHKAVNEAGVQTGKDFDNGVRDYLQIESPSKVMEKNGEYATQGLAKGMINPTSQMFIRAACNKIGQQIVTTVQQTMPKNKFVEMGSQMMNGLPEGWNKMLPNILSKATALAARILAVFSNAWRIKSPSRAFAEIGEYAMAGLGEGFKTGEPEVDDQVTRTSDDILNQMKSQIAAITNGWSEDNVYQPVIRPVFDMDGIQTGYNDIQSWFANAQGLNLSGNLTRLTPTTTDDSTSNQQIIDAINNINNDDVVREIGNLRNDISQLQSAMTNLQVVMNTGALVGQLVDPIDSALGMKSLMNTRGRY